MLDVILKVFAEVTFYLFLVTSVIFGISLAVNLLISTTVKKIVKESDKNYATLMPSEIDECNAIITAVKHDLSFLSTQTKKNKKIRQNNRFLKFFNLTERQETVIEKDFNTITNNALKDVFNVFNRDRKNAKKSFLSLSEQDIFLIAITLKERLTCLINSSKIIWLKRLPISVILYCLSIYNQAIKIKNKFFVALCFKLIEFCGWFTKMLSPASLWKQIVKDLSGESLEEIITYSLIEIVLKELCVIYKEVANGKVEVNI